MFLLVAFMLMGNMLKFLNVQCTLVIPYTHVTEQKLLNLQKGVFGVALIYFELILVISPLDLKMYCIKNSVVFSMDHPCGT